MAGSVNRAGLPETGTCTAQRRGQGSKTAAGRQRTTAGQGAPTLTPRTACYGEGNNKTPHPRTSRAPGQAQRAGSTGLPEASGIPAERPRQAPPGSGQRSGVARRRQPGRPNPRTDNRPSAQRQGLPEMLYKSTAFVKEKLMHREFRQLYQPRFQRRSEWLRRVWRWF